MARSDRREPHRAAPRGRGLGRWARRAATLGTALLGACFLPRVSADYFPPVESASSGSDAATAGSGEPESTSDGTGPVPSTTGSATDDTSTATGDTGMAVEPVEQVRLTVRTSEQGGPYRPRNVGAIWIEDGGGAFVKTLEKWGTIRDRWLGRWREASDRNVVDAVTSATLPAHETHEVVWDLRDAEGHEAEPGEYVVLIEVTDRSGPGAVLEIRFGTGQGPMMLAPEETEHYHDLVLVVE